MNEKDSVNDTLSSIVAAITAINYAIQHSNNQDFRELLIDSRNEFEALHWSVYIIARDKGYYVPAAPAGQADISAVAQVVSK